MLLTLFVLYIIWMVLVLFQAVSTAGAIRDIGQGIVQFTPDRLLQSSILAWAFGAFLQGVAGFGVPVTVVAPPGWPSPGRNVHVSRTNYVYVNGHWRFFHGAVCQQACTSVSQLEFTVKKLVEGIRIYGQFTESSLGASPSVDLSDGGLFNQMIIPMLLFWAARAEATEWVLILLVVMADGMALAMGVS